jgi:hypothetical protein
VQTAEVVTVGQTSPFFLGVSGWNFFRNVHGVRPRLGRQHVQHYSSVQRVYIQCIAGHLRRWKNDVIKISRWRPAAATFSASRQAIIVAWHRLVVVSTAAKYIPTCV